MCVSVRACDFQRFEQAEYELTSVSTDLSTDLTRPERYAPTANIFAHHIAQY